MLWGRLKISLVLALILALVGGDLAWAVRTGGAPRSKPFRIRAKLTAIREHLRSAGDGIVAGAHAVASVPNRIRGVASTAAGRIRDAAVHVGGWVKQIPKAAADVPRKVEDTIQDVKEVFVPRKYVYDPKAAPFGCREVEHLPEVEAASVRRVAGALRTVPDATLPAQACVAQSATCAPPVAGSRLDNILGLLKDLDESVAPTVRRQRVTEKMAKEESLYFSVPDFFKTMDFRFFDPETGKILRERDEEVFQAYRGAVEHPGKEGEVRKKKRDVQAKMRAARRDVVDKHQKFLAAAENSRIAEALESEWKEKIRSIEESWDRLQAEKKLEEATRKRAKEISEIDAQLEQHQEMLADLKKHREKTFSTRAEALEESRKSREAFLAAEKALAQAENEDRTLEAEAQELAQVNPQDRYKVLSSYRHRWTAERYEVLTVLQHAEQVFPEDGADDLSQMDAAGASHIHVRRLSQLLPPGDAARRMAEIRRDVEIAQASMSLITGLARSVASLAPNAFFGDSAGRALSMAAGGAEFVTLFLSEFAGTLSGFRQCARVSARKHFLQQRGLESLGEHLSHSELFKKPMAKLTVLMSALIKATPLSDADQYKAKALIDNIQLISRAVQDPSHIGNLSGPIQQVLATLSTLVPSGPVVLDPTRLRDAMTILDTLATPDRVPVRRVDVSPPPLSFLLPTLRTARGRDLVVKDLMSEIRELATLSHAPTHSPFAATSAEQTEAQFQGMLEYEHQFRALYDRQLQYKAQEMWSLLAAANELAESQPDHRAEIQKRVSSICGQTLAWHATQTQEDLKVFDQTEFAYLEAFLQTQIENLDQEIKGIPKEIADLDKELTKGDSLVRVLQSSAAQSIRKTHDLPQKAAAFLAKKPQIQAQMDALKQALPELKTRRVDFQRRLEGAQRGEVLPPLLDPTLVAIDLAVESEALSVLGESRQGSVDFKHDLSEIKSAHTEPARAPSIRKRPPQSATDAASVPSDASLKEIEVDVGGTTPKKSESLQIPPRPTIPVIPPRPK